MTEQMIVWLVTTAVPVCVFAIRNALKYRRRPRRTTVFPRHFIKLGSEREMFYMPGDNDDDDF